VQHLAVVAMVVGIIPLLHQAVAVVDFMAVAVLALTAAAEAVQGMLDKQLAQQIQQERRQQAQRAVL
jgi:membrane protein implicated in regulation of membrane protease activity